MFGTSLKQQSSTLPKDYLYLTIEELDQLMQKGQVLVIDVRNSEEFEDCHIFGAKHLPLENLMKSLPNFPKELNIVAVSNPGDGRAEKVTRLLVERAWLNAKYLYEGQSAWVEAGLPTTEAGAVSS